MATNIMTRLRPAFQHKDGVSNAGKARSTSHLDFAIGFRTVQRKGQRHMMGERIYSPMKDYRPVPGATNEHNATNGELARFVGLERAAQFIAEVDMITSKTPMGELLALAHRLAI